MSLSAQLYTRTQRTPYWRTLLALVTGLGSGLALTSWSMDREAEARSSAVDEATALYVHLGGAAGEPIVVRHELAPEEELAAEAENSVNTGGIGEEIEPAEEAEENLEQVEGAEDEGGANEDPLVAVPNAPQRPSGPPDRRFSRGRLAYLRCSNLEEGGRCPRDRELESAAWDALEVSTHCGLPAGSADLRLHFNGGEPEVRFRDFGDAPIDAGTLHACVAAHMAPLRSSMAHSFVLSIRFFLE